MPNGVDETPARAGHQAAKMVPFAYLARQTHHRISEPTKAEIKSAVGDLTTLRGWGHTPLVDAVILACVRMGRRDLATLAAEVAKIEKEQFPAPELEPGS